MTATAAADVGRVHTRERAVAVRVAETLERCRAVLGDDHFGDAMVERVLDGDMHEALRAVESATTSVTERLAGLAPRTRSVGVLRVQELLSELQSQWHEIQQDYLARQVAMLGGIREALHRLRGAETTAQMIDRATVEACRSCGVDRCVLLRVEEGSLIPESVCFARDPAFQEEWETFARAHPPEVDPRDPEVQLLRRNRPILVADPSASRGIAPCAEAARSTGYIAAPVTVRGSVVATLHADIYFAERRVDPMVRDVLATFAVGYGYALERTVVLERTREQVRRMRETMSEVNSSFDDLFEAGVSLRRNEGGDVAAVTRGPAMLLPGESRISGLLTRRELEVIDLMARGASNADIAGQLVISEGTVKSHVKHILRKMRAANRAQAVSCYMRLQSLDRA
jgi:DNA-binding NarL/FixJ family response regulator